MRFALLLVGVLACASSVIFVRESQQSAAWLAVWRLWVAVLCLLPWAWRDYQRLRPDIKILLRQAWLPGCVLGLHFIAWNAGARMVPAAMGTLLVNLTPLVMPGLLWCLYRQRVTPREWQATAMALCGFFILSWSTLQWDMAYWQGSAVVLLAMLSFALYLASAASSHIGRNIGSIWLYLLPVYAVAGVLCLVLSWLTEPFHGFVDGYDMLMTVSLGLVSTVIGHSILNWCMQHISGQRVTVVNSMQFVFAGVLGWWWYGELPGLAFYAASGLILMSLLWLAQEA